MKLLLIAPASGGWHRVGRSPFFGGRVFRFSLLSLLSVAGVTPREVEVEIVDEQVHDLPLGRSFDLVGISCMTAAAPRAYALADAYRRKGASVVLGGMHPTLMPGEALQHADAVCVGEAERVWPRIVEDARSGKLGGLYHGGLPALEGLPIPPRQLLDRRHYGTLQAVQATRGCPNRCAFCSVSAFHGGNLRCRPVGEVVREVGALPRRFLVLVDDNLTADPQYARELFRALRPLNKLWIGQATLGLAEDAELVRLAADAGCIGLFVGLESFCEENLHAVDKGFHRVQEYRERIRVLHAHGIGVEAGITLGFERDRTPVFRATLDALDTLEIDLAQISILTPLPGTPLHERWSDRIVDRDWSRYDFHHVVFRPRHMTGGQLQAGHDWLTREFYRPWRIARRLARMSLRPGGCRSLPYAAAINAGYYGRTVRWRIRGRDPDCSGARAVTRPAPAAQREG